MKNIDFNIDKIILLLLPVFGMIIFLIFDGKPLYLSIFLITVLVFYELIMYKLRYVYGFSGLINLSIPSIVLFSFTVFLAIPGIYIASIYEHPAVFPYFFSILSFYIILPFGYLFGYFLSPINSQKLNDLRKNHFQKNSIDPIVYEFLLFMFIFMGLIIILYFIRVDKIPLIEMIKNPGEYVKLKILREEALKVLEVTFIERYLFNWVRSLFLPICIVASLFLSMIYKQSKYYLLFVIYLVIGLIFNSITLEKSPAAAIILSLVAILFLRQRKIRFVFVLISIVLIFLIPALIMYFLQFGREDVWDVVFVSLFLRVFVVPTESLYSYFKIFPETHNFLYGRSTNLFSWLHPEGTFDTSNYVAKVIWKIPSTTGSVNVNFLGNFWADFGYTGIIISIFLVGLIIHLFYRKLLIISDYKKNILYTTIVCSTTSIFSFGFFSSNFSTLFFTRGLILVVFFFIIFSRLKTFLLRH